MASRNMPCIGLPGFAQVHGLLEYLIANVTAQLMLRQQFHATLEQLRQPFGQRQTLREQVVATGEIHQKIHIAVGPLLA